MKKEKQEGATLYTNNFKINEFGFSQLVTCKKGISFGVTKIPRLPSGWLKAGTIGAVCVITVFNSLYNVEGGRRAIVFNRIYGVEDKVHPEGTHKIPFLERAIIYDVRAHPHLVESSAGSLDLQMVKIGLRVLTRPVLDQLPPIYRTVGKDYDKTVLPSLIHETLKAVVAQYNASQLLTQREVAAQEAELAKFVVEKAEQDKRSAVIRAQGEAKSAQLIGQAIAKNPAFIALRKIEAARDIAQMISNSNSRVFLNTNELLLNLQDMNLKTTAHKK